MRTRYSQVGYIPKKIGQSWITETKELSAMITGLMKYLNEESP